MHGPINIRFSLVCVGPLLLVTGEENSPTAAHQSRKSRQIWVSRAWGTAGLPCRGGYKYDGLDLQVGVGRQAGSVTVKKKKKTVTKPEMSPRNVQTEWERSNDRAVSSIRRRGSV